MKNTKIRILSFILAAAMLTGCGASAESDSMTESSQNDSSSVDSKLDSESKTDTTDDSKSDSSSDESKSEKAATTTKTSESKNESEKAVTTTKQSSTTSAVATQPVATKATAKPIVTTKATQKPTVTAKQTTKATPKVTSKQTADPTANMSPYYKALYRIGSGKGTTSDYETVRNEIINYGKKLYPNFRLDKNLHLYRLPNGKLTDDYQAGVSFNDITCRDTLCLPSTSKEGIEYFDRMYKLLVHQNLDGYAGADLDGFDVRWYVQFSKQQIGTCVIVLAKAE